MEWHENGNKKGEKKNDNNEGEVRKCDSTLFL